MTTVNPNHVVDLKDLEVNVNYIIGLNYRNGQAVITFKQSSYEHCDCSREEFNEFKAEVKLTRKAIHDTRGDKDEQ